MDAKFVLNPQKIKILRLIKLNIGRDFSKKSLWEKRLDYIKVACTTSFYILFLRDYTRHVPRAMDSRACRSCSISHCLGRERIALLGRSSIIRHLSSLRFYAISFPRRTHSYRSAHSRRTAGGLCSGGWRIDIYTSRNRSTAERVSHREGARIAASSRRAPHPQWDFINPFASASVLRATSTLSSHVIVRVIIAERKINDWYHLFLEAISFSVIFFLIERGNCWFFILILWLLLRDKFKKCVVYPFSFATYYPWFYDNFFLTSSILLLVLSIVTQIFEAVEK